uniref:phospholipase D n=1 Tax=Nitratidesulfovibrio vulgaris (strain DSM 19637 / Miyazaki F) TaxID=883 RepID=B8DIZ8_NITV9
MTRRLRITPLLILVLALTFALPSRASAYDLTLSQGTKAEVYFSPRGGATEAIVKHVRQAKHTVYVLAYSFTSPAISQALIEAKLRGVNVEVILDKSQSRGQGAAGGTLRDAGVKVHIDSVHAIAHNKVMLVDSHTLITGSFNFTRAAESRNAENLLVLESPEAVGLYMEEFRKHLGHSQYLSRD